MAALTADRNTPHKDGDLLPVLVAGATKIYAGAIVVANAGYAEPGSTALNLVYLGRADESVDNSAGADGAKTVTVRRNKAFKWANSGADAITQAEVGKTCYIVDDQTVAKTDGGGTRSAAGKVVGLDADGVWVE
ncbi:hypothetical protein [Herbaspirillum sp. ST 5-3]|uniref:hypothetical protein n=1 Tax=Oxalobacteraceae TaxID=75682 RepID=UPI0010A30F17|nr:hypothetical protein [Herbaspirillum sp. ST 5-3]